MKSPTVTIIGQPNVGKSTLFNALLKRRMAIVDNTPGTTRDSLAGFCHYNNFILELIDTGGLTLTEKDTLFLAIRQQIEKSIKQADLLLFLTDIRNGVTPLDQKIANLLRTKNRPLILVTTKADTRKFETDKDDFYALGLGEPMPVSALQKRGLTELLERIIRHIRKLGYSPIKYAPEKKEPLKLAVIGKRNVGKSTLVNTLAREERVIVSETPGITRDAIDVRFERDGKSFIAIDTAGLRKKQQARDAAEIFSRFRAESTIKRADVVLFLIDAQEPISRVDKKIGDFIIRHVKPCIIIVNKWDLVEKETSTNDYIKYLARTLIGLKFFPLSFISAKTNFNVWETISIAEDLFKQSGMKISTPFLNQVLQKIRKKREPTAKARGTPKIYYGTQTGIHPPKFVIFVNDPTLFESNYQRYLLNCLHEELPISEVPLQIQFRQRSRKDYTLQV